jgi:hypothetical protein
LWRTYISHVEERPYDSSILPHDVANMMILVKIARSMYGDYHEDNFVDAAGYAALAGMLAPQGPKVADDKK